VSAGIGLARRPVACKRFRWMPGMLEATSGWRCVGVFDQAQDDGSIVPMLRVSRHGGRYLGDAAAVDGWLPDLADPATLGCFLALVREAWEDPGMRPERHDGIWIIRKPSGELIEGPSGSAMFSEAEALVAALEAAP
jgi:hypothetical protein